MSKIPGFEGKNPGVCRSAFGFTCSLILVSVGIIPSRQKLAKGANDGRVASCGEKNAQMT